MYASDWFHMYMIKLNCKVNQFLIGLKNSKVINNNCDNNIVLYIKLF